MHNFFPDIPALILIDIQKAFDDVAAYGGARNNPAAENNCSLLLTHWRKKGWPLFHIKHCSMQPGSLLTEGYPGNSFKDEVMPLPGEPVIKKHVNSAFIGTDLKERLDASGIKTVVITGLTTEHCVSTTTRMASNYGYKTFLVTDATVSFPKRGANGVLYPASLVHDLSLATLSEEFATLIATDDICVGQQ